nr:MAG TPA: hypothetical protein [Caudoviricetes sp.]
MLYLSIKKCIDNPKKYTRGENIKRAAISEGV